MSRSAFAYLFLIISLLGFSDATFLTVEHYLGAVPPCAIVVGCEIVTTSKYSLIFSIPVALLGALYYLAIFLSSIVYLDTKNDRWLKRVAWLTPLGFLASLWFIYIQWVVIKAWCLYCLGSVATSTLLFFLGILLLTHHETWWQKIIKKL